MPAYFSEEQRDSTKIAAEIAGYNVLKIIAEPVAAALAYGFSSNLHDGAQENILVYDLGEYQMVTKY